MLLASCKAAGVITLTYTWKQRQRRCKLHELLFPEAVRGAVGPLTALDKILPCVGRMDDRCVADLVHGGCNPVTAAAILADLGRAAVDAAAELVARLVAKLVARLVARSLVRLVARLVARLSQPQMSMPQRRGQGDATTRRKADDRQRRR